MENKDWLINLIYCELPGILNDATFIGLAAAIRKEIGKITAEYLGELDTERQNVVDNYGYTIHKISGKIDGVKELLRRLK